jgi:hypothetical protein
MKNDWIAVDPRNLNKPQRQQTNSGVEIELYMSPYDIPQAVNGRYDESKKRFVIEFSYIAGDEPRKCVPQDEHLSLYVGKQTNRLYAIEVDIDALQAETVALTVSQRIQNAMDALSSQPPRANHQIAREVIRSKHAELLSRLATLAS